VYYADCLSAIELGTRIMIRNSTVLILGAGASIPYGFPSGTELTNQILIALANRGSSFANDIEACGFEWDFVHRFRQELYLSSQPSIDAFLEHRTEFIEVGKTCIARALTPYEDDNLSRGVDRHWYQYLFQKLNTTPDKFHENKLSVITFNYDRSFEQFLFTALKYSYGLLDIDAAALVRMIPIIHLHGDLGKLPVLYGEGKPYTPEIEIPLLKQSASAIKVVHEDLDANLQFDEAHKLIVQAHDICFLGFGFHPKNLERLSISYNRMDNQNLISRIFATTYKMPKNDQNIAEGQIRNRFDPTVYTQSDSDVLQALWDWSILR
jgi:SIR2-like domain